MLHGPPSAIIRAFCVFVLLTVFSFKTDAKLSVGPSLVSSRRYLEETNSYYLNGSLLTSGINLYLIYYGSSWSNPSTLSIIETFIQSLSPSSVEIASPNLPSWWNIATAYYDSDGNHVKGDVSYKGKYTFPSSSFFPDLTQSYMNASAIIGYSIENGGLPLDESAIYIILTGSDINVTGSCSNSCGTRGYFGYSTTYLTYAWAHDGSIECPSVCYPFNSTLLPPNGDIVGDGTVVQLSWAIPATATDPFFDGWEHTSGYALIGSCYRVVGETLYTNPLTNGVYNIYGLNNSTFLVYQLYDLNRTGCALQGTSNTLPPSSQPPSQLSPPPIESQLSPPPIESQLSPPPIESQLSPPPIESQLSPPPIGSQLLPPQSQSVPPPFGTPTPPSPSSSNSKSMQPIFQAWVVILVISLFLFLQ